MTTRRPASTRRSLPISLLRTREVVMQHFRPLLAELGVTEQQWRVLRVLGENGPSEAGDVAAAACILPPSLSRITQALMKAKLIRSAIDRADGRRSIISLTERGLQMLQSSSSQSGAVYGQMERSIGKDKLERLLDLLEDVQSAMRQDE
jgi:homoprotocatechuate degradation regulator HpaR